MQFNFLLLTTLIFLVGALNGTSASNSKAELRNATSCNDQYHNHEAVTASVEKAKALMLNHPTDVPIKDRLLVQVLFSKGFVNSPEMSGRLKYLKCALLKLKANMMEKTTIDVFIWTLNSTSVVPVIPDWFNGEDFPRMNIISIEPDTWRIPCGLISDTKWALRKHFDIDYYLMGRWRLSFSLDFAKEMGYAYHLQFDDDAMLNGKLDFNIVEKLNEKKLLMAVSSTTIPDARQVTLGLPDLTHYWMTLKTYTPKGPLFKHLDPPSVEGLTSAGWDRLVHPGYFIIISTEFWFQKLVQDYLTTVFRSGRDVEGRWQEQAVMNMMRLVFVPEDKLWIMSEADIGHDRHDPKNFDNWCVKPGLVSN